jgi:hypothetical protein
MPADAPCDPSGSSSVPRYCGAPPKFQQASVSGSQISWSCDHPIPSDVHAIGWKLRLGWMIWAPASCVPMTTSANDTNSVLFTKFSE